MQKLKVFNTVLCPPKWTAMIFIFPLYLGVTVAVYAQDESAVPIKLSKVDTKETTGAGKKETAGKQEAVNKQDKLGDAPKDEKNAPATPQKLDDQTISRVTMKESIAYAREQKIKELAATLRQQLNKDTPLPANLSGKPDQVRPDQLKGDASLSVEPSKPRLWSLTSTGVRTWAEVLMDGKIIQLDAMDGQLMQMDSDDREPNLGPWKIITLTETGLLLGREVQQQAKKDKTGKKSKQVAQQERMLLRPPARGISVMNYQFTAPVKNDTMLLQESARRAAELPVNPMR